MKILRILTRKLREKIKLLRCLMLYLFSFLNQDGNKLVIVTGSDSSHYKSLCQFLSSLFLHEPKIKVIAYDLGLTESERQYIIANFPKAEIRLFDYSLYPDYFNIKTRAGEYAWKPVILYEVLNEFKCCVCWMDAGNLLIEPLFWLRIITRTLGMYSPYSLETVSLWTHPKTLSFLNASSNILAKRNLNGACVSISYKNEKAQKLAERWKEYALIKECIAPEGSSRKNHRQDQAVLSVIAHQSGITKNMPTGFYGFKHHKDIR
ncbi:MAG: DUF1647 domain-containing protein [Thermodesulfobacteriota bacterium]